MRVVALSLLLLAAACSADDATQVLVWVDADQGSALRSTAAALRVRVLDQDGAVTLDETRGLAGDPPEVELPASISLVPRGDDPSRRYRVEASLLDEADVELARQVAEGGFVDHALREIWLRFSDACAGVECGIGRTCIDGTCERACFAPRPAGQAVPSEPGPCPCACTCAGDRCEDGRCVPRAPAVEVAAGHDHACAIDGDGLLSCWGSNASGQLGLGDLETRDLPTVVELPAAVRAVGASATHTCAVTVDGAVYCWGANASGQLGAPGEDSPTPVAVTADGGAPLGELTTVAAGAQHTCVARADGTLFCWGANDAGQLGAGSTGEPLPPTEVAAPPSAQGGLTRVFLGESHTCALQNIGRLWCWGRNNDGPLGLGDRLDRNIPELVAIPEGTDAEAWSEATTGAWHTCAILADGELFCWGAVTEGRLGLPGINDEDYEWPTRVLADIDWRGTSVAAGRRHTCAIQDDGSAWCFGTGGDGELGVGDAVPDPPEPVQLRDDDWERLALGDSFTCGRRAGGGLWCWGANEAGQLGLGTREARSEPARVCLP